MCPNCPNFFKLPIPISLKGVKVLGVQQNSESVNIRLMRNVNFDVCPYCGQISKAPHARLSYLVIDRPLYKMRVELSVIKRRFKCLNPQCERAAFTERIEGLQQGCFYTEAFKDFLYELSKKMTYIDVSRHLQENYNTKVERRLSTM